MAEEQQAKPIVKEKLARGVVARGRTIRAPHPTEVEIKGTNPETGEVIRGPKIIEFGPGQEVTLPEQEIQRMRAQGFLIDPEKSDGSIPSEGSFAKEVS